MDDQHSHPHWQLHPTDQSTVAMLVSMALIAMIAYWAFQNGSTGTLVEIDRAAPLEAHFEVDINAADTPELTQLPGIGPALAHRIVESRKTQGPFVRHEDILRIKGIGDKKFDQIRPYLKPMPKQ